LSNANLFLVGPFFADCEKFLWIKVQPFGVGIWIVSFDFLFGQIELACPDLIPVGWAFFFYGEFDPGSG
jgi:hypothetical protein